MSVYRVGMSLKLSFKMPLWLLVGSTEVETTVPIATSPLYLHLQKIFKASWAETFARRGSFHQSRGMYKYGMQE